MNFSEFAHNMVPNRLSESGENTARLAIGRVEASDVDRAGDIRSKILDELYRYGWSGEAKLDPASSMTITSVRDSIGLCFQTGNVARIYADLLKLQLLFSRAKITSGILIVFCRTMAASLGENIATFERLRRELAIFEEVITVPILVLGLGVME